MCESCDLQFSILHNLGGDSFFGQIQLFVFLKKAVASMIMKDSLAAMMKVKQMKMARFFFNPFQYFEIDRDMENFTLQCLPDGSFSLPDSGNMNGCVDSKHSKKLDRFSFIN